MATTAATRRSRSAAGAGSVDCGRFDEGMRDGLKPGQEKQKVIGDLTPSRCDDDEGHGLRAIEGVVPILPTLFMKKATMPTVGLNRKNHRTPATTGATA